MAEHERTGHGPPASRSGETFKREGPEPPEQSTGRTVEEMNERAREAVRRNVRPPVPDEKSGDGTDDSGGGPSS